ncbi:MAG: PQQ-binding-like beta-propeller repeat protein [Microbacteriaceae bacterium]|nr:PQQ-binding-like beta-propeller repeat protein [Microbacteriaceae bacterium]
METIQQEARRPAPKVSRSISIATSAAIVLATIGAGSLVSIAGSVDTKVLGGVASGFVPPDGESDAYSDDTGAMFVAESARSVGYTDILLLPDKVASVLFSYLSEEEMRTIQLWRQTSTPVAGGDQTTDLHRLSTEGLSLLASYGGSLGLVYNPPLLELPASVGVGSEWQSKGEALPGGILTYSSNFKAVAPSSQELISLSGLSSAELKDCIQTEGSSTYLDNNSDPFIQWSESNLWCKGKGKVAAIGTINGTKVSQGPAPIASALDRIPKLPAVPVKWQDTDSWALSTAELGYLDPFFLEQKLILALSISPIRTPSGTIVALNQTGNDLVALEYSNGKFERKWFAHPGGEVLSMAAFDNLIVATTSTRDVVGYSETGVRLWTLRTAELTLSTPAEVPASEAGGDAAVAVVSLDGRVQLLDADTGKVRWQRQIPADVSANIVVGSGQVIVADRGGTVWAFRISDGKSAWTSQAGEPATSLLIGTALIVVDQNGGITAMDVSSGETVWNKSYRGSVRSVLETAGKLVVVTQEQSFELSPDDGTLIWSGEGGASAVTDGESLVLFTSDEARLLDAEGRLAKTWKLPSLDNEINRFDLAAADGLLAFVSYQGVTIVGTP